jgi:nifR3 family TIM-barrel protein
MRIHPLEALKKNPFVLAPMAGITDLPFRSFMREMGTGVVISELVSAVGIEYKSERTLRLMAFEEVQRPVGIQLFGEDAESIANAAKVVEQLGADFVDLNFGCPVPKVVKKGAGSAMLKDLDQLTKVLRASVQAVKIPVTIKIRTGWDATSRNAHEVANIAYNEGISWVAIHGRTRAQSYSGLSDWDYIAEVKAQAKLPIIGNGDILFPGQAVERLKQSGCDGVMIGRGALKNPYIFRDAMALWQGGSLSKTDDRNFEHVFLSLSQVIKKHCDDHITNIQLKKFAAWFATGYPGASQFRKNIFQTKSNDEVMSMALGYFSEQKSTHQADTSSEAFLMGGHG